MKNKNETKLNNKKFICVSDSASQKVPANNLITSALPTSQ